MSDLFPSIVIDCHIGAPAEPGVLLFQLVKISSVLPRMPLVRMTEMSNVSEFKAARSKQPNGLNLVTKAENNH